MSRGATIACLAESLHEQRKKAQLHSLPASRREQFADHAADLPHGQQRGSGSWRTTLHGDHDLGGIDRRAEGIPSARSTRRFRSPDLLRLQPETFHANLLLFTSAESCRALARIFVGWDRCRRIAILDRIRTKCTCQSRAPQTRISWTRISWTRVF